MLFARSAAMTLYLLDPHDHDFAGLDIAEALAERDGLLCLSRDLAPQRLLAAYRAGVFPWFSEAGYFYWFAVDPRAVLLPERLHISRSLRKTLRNARYRVTLDHCFERVVAACAEAARHGQNGTWIAPEFQAAYTALHRLGHTHSFECWYPDEHGQPVLAGGGYGVQIGSVFYGESMFARQTDASKIAFAHAVPHLSACGVRLIDCQQDTAHLARFGSHTLPFGEFQAALDVLTRQELQKPLRSTVLADRFQV